MFGANCCSGPRGWRVKGGASALCRCHTYKQTQHHITITINTTIANNSAQSRSECHFELGVARQKGRDYRRAAAEFARAAELDPANFQVRRWCGWVVCGWVEGCGRMAWGHVLTRGCGKTVHINTIAWTIPKTAQQTHNNNKHHRPSPPQKAWNLLGLCRVSMGDIRDGVAAYEKALALSPDSREAWLNLGQALKEEGRTREAERALTRLIAAEPRTPGGLAAYRLLAQMRQGQGRHADAIKLCDKALALGSDDLVRALSCLASLCLSVCVCCDGAVVVCVVSVCCSLSTWRPPLCASHSHAEHARARTTLHTHALASLCLGRQRGRHRQRLELLYARAICHHALGDVRSAAADYEAAFACDPLKSAGRGAVAPSEEAVAFKYLSFFQREMALYLVRGDWVLY